MHEIAGEALRAQEFCASPEKALVTLIRYWGSYLKSPRAGQRLASELRLPAVKGWTSYLVCCQPPERKEWLAPLLDLGVRIEYLPRASGNFDLGCIRRVYDLCRCLQCRVFHCDNTHTSPLIGAALAGVPVRIWSKRSMNAVFEAGRHPTARDRIALSVRTSCLLATRVLAVSEAVKNELMDLGIPSTRVSVLNNPVLPDEVQPVDRAMARAGLGLSASAVVFSAVGHAVPVKGWDLLVEAFASVADSIPEAYLLLVGSTSADHERPFFAELSRFIEAKKLASRVRFTGHLTCLAAVLAATDVFVLPSRSEGFGIALAEALAAGLACVAFRVGGAPEMIRGNVNGLLVERGDVRRLADGMKKLANDPMLRRRLAGHARSSSPLLTPAEHGDCLFALYDSSLAARNYQPPSASAAANPRQVDA